MEDLQWIRPPAVRILLLIFLMHIYVLPAVRQNNNVTPTKQRNICPRWNHTGPKVHAKNSACDCDTCNIFYPSIKLCHGWALFVYYNDHVEYVTYHCFFSPGWKYKSFLLCQSLHFYLIGPMRCCLCVGTAVYVYLLLVLLKPEQMKSFSCPIKKLH